MGMSASQARYIALTARMNDTEYEVQQINQQRLTLSNKMNEVQERAMNMEVPTPPSKQEYMYPVYVGRKGKNKYTVKDGANGVPTIFIQGNGTFVTPSTTGKVGNEGISLDKYLNKDTVYSAENFTKYDPSDYQKCITGSSVSDFDKITSHKVSGKITKNTYVQSENKNYDKNDPDSQQYTYEYKTEDVVIPDMDYDKFLEAYGKEVPNNTLGDVFYSNLDQLTHKIEGYKNADSFESGSEYVKKGSTERVSGSELLKHNSTVEQRQDMDFAVSDGNGGYKHVKGSEVLSAASGNAIYAIKDVKGFDKAKELADGGATGKTVGGDATMLLSEAKEKFGEESAFMDAINGLKNTFPDEYAESIDNFSVIINVDSNGKSTYSFCQTKDIKDGAEISVLTVGEGDYETEVKDADAQIIMDETGGFVKQIIVNGVTIKMEEESECDEDRYDAAMDKYRLDKIEYDEEQNELNKKTSIYQRQDKQLELKLTRLDTERNALNTELEAVKKVIQDAVDKGFKTFSG